MECCSGDGPVTFETDRRGPAQEGESLMSRGCLSIASLAVLLIVFGAGGASARPSRGQKNTPSKENPQSKLKRLRKQVQLVNPEALRRSVTDLAKRFPAYASKSRAWPCSPTERSPAKAAC